MIERPDNNIEKTSIRRRALALLKKFHPDLHAGEDNVQDATELTSVLTSVMNLERSERMPESFRGKLLQIVFLNSNGQSLKLSNPLMVADYPEKFLADLEYIVENEELPPASQETTSRESEISEWFNFVKTEIDQIKTLDALKQYKTRLIKFIESNGVSQDLVVLLSQRIQEKENSLRKEEYDTWLKSVHSGIDKIKNRRELKKYRERFVSLKSRTGIIASDFDAVLKKLDEMDVSLPEGDESDESSSPIRHQKYVDDKLVDEGDSEK
jgi:predicted metal-dependent hydrolase